MDPRLVRARRLYAVVLGGCEGQGPTPLLLAVMRLEDPRATSILSSGHVIRLFRYFLPTRAWVTLAIAVVYFFLYILYMLRGDSCYVFRGGYSTHFFYTD